jgi:nicotinamidase-related amidase
MGRILVLGEPGNRIIPELAPIEGEVLLGKPGKGAFYATNLQQILKEKAITHLAFAGVTTEVCVQTTMREANDRGYESILLEDCTASYFPEFKKATIEMIRAQGGIVGWTTTSDQLLKALGG